MSNTNKTKALEKHKHGGKCHCGKEKGHEGKHREGGKLENVTFEKEKGHKDEEEEEDE